MNNQVNRQSLPAPMRKHKYPEGEPTCVYCGAFGPVEDNEYCATRLEHAIAALRFIARIADEPGGDVGQFALRASETPPSAFAPPYDYCEHDREACPGAICKGECLGIEGEN